MILITGDIHRSEIRINGLQGICKKYKTTKEDFMVVLGDAGINYFCGLTDKEIKVRLEKLPVTFLFVHGNHEIRPESYGGYKEKEMFGGKAYVEEDFPSLIFLKDGETYNIDNKKTLCLGGAYSVDKYYRLRNGYRWFSDEQTSPEERERILADVTGKEFDMVISHTCPFEWEPTDLFLRGIDQSAVDTSQEMWLSEIKKVIKYKDWYFGHFHSERDGEENRHMLFNNWIVISD